MKLKRILFGTVAGLLVAGCGSSESGPANSQAGNVRPAKPPEASASSRSLNYVGLTCEFSVKDQSTGGARQSVHLFAVSVDSPMYGRSYVELLITASGERVSLHGLKLEYREDHGGQVSYRYEVLVVSRDGKRLSSAIENTDFPLDPHVSGGGSQTVSTPMGEKGTIEIRTRCEAVRAA